MTGYHSFLLLVALAQGLHAVHWTGGPQNGDIIYACQGTNVTLPWHLQLGPGDVIKDIEWFYRGLSEELVGILIHEAFMAYPSFAGRVSHVDNAGIILTGLIPADSGNFSVEVTGFNASGHIFELRQLVTVKIFDQLMTKGDALQVSRSAELVMDNTTGSWTIHLLCGFFSFPGKPPYFMEWITPNGVVRKSSSYDRGYFHLPLSGSIASGTYRCRVPEQHLNDSCLPGQNSAQTEASMALDGVDARLTLMGKEMEELSAENKLLSSQNHQLMTENSQLFAYLQRLEQQLRDTNLRLDVVTAQKEQTTTGTSPTMTSPPTSSAAPKEQTTTGTSPTVTNPPTSSADEEGPPQWSPLKTDLWYLTRTVNSFVELKCPARGTPTPNITWLKDGQPLPSSQMKRVNMKGFVLTIVDLLPADSGQYTCVISNKHGSINWTYTVDIMPPKEQTTTGTSPTMTNPPTSSAAPKEQTTTGTSPTVTSPPTSSTAPKEQTSTGTSPTMTNPPTSSADDTSGEASCNFDSGMCAWTQDKTDNFDWLRHRGSTSSTGTGPSADHTSGNGYYVYIETSGSRRNGDTARLISPMLSGTPRCLSFWYCMYGGHIGNLTVYVRTGVTLGAPVFTRSHNQGQSWLEASVDISSSSSPFQVVIEATRGISYRGDIAIDDVSVSSGPCPATRPQRDGFQ